MATVVNARDVQIQSQLPRVATLSAASNLVVSQSQVTGLGLVVEGTKTVFLQSSTQVFQIAKSGTVTPASATLTAVLRNLTSAASLSVVSGTISPAPTLTANQVTINASAMTTDTATVRVTVVENGTTYTDDITLVKVREGTDALVGFLTNENCTITADYLGNPLSYAGATGTFKVFQGTTDITTLCTFALAPSGNPSTLTYSLGATTGVYSVTAGYPTATDLTSLTFRATFGSATMDKLLTIGKQKAPTPSKTLVLGADKQIFTYNTTGTAYPPSQTVTLTAAGQNLAGNPSWTCTLYDSSNTSLGAGTLGGASTASTRTFDISAIGTAVYAKIVVTWDSLSDTTTVVKLQDGSAGISPVTGFLTNEAMVVATDASGTVASFATAGGTLKVYDGTTDKTGNAAVTYSVAASSGVTISIASTGVYSITAMSADTATATLRAVYNGVTIDKNYSIAKSKAGAGGVTNIVGFLTNEATVVPTANDGSGGVFTSSGGTFKVFDGITDKTGNVAVTYSVASSSGVTISIASTGVYSITAMSADSGTATLRAVYSGVTLDKIFSIAKSKAGTTGTAGSNGTNGTNAQVLVLTSTAQTITFDKANALNPASQTISFTANLQNVAGTATFVATPYSITNVAGTPITLGGSGNTRTLTGAQFSTNAYVVVTASLSGLSDTITVVKLKDGADGAAGTNGTNGATGATGQRGSRTWYVTLTGTTSTYSTSLATTTATQDGGPVLNDTVTQYNNSQNYSETRFWNGSAWVVVNAIVDGNLLVPGTVGAGAISTSSLSAISASLGSVQIDSGGYLKSNGATSYAVGAGFWLGYDSATYKFRVGDPAGNNLSWDGTTLNINGNLVSATGTFSGAINVGSYTGYTWPASGGTGAHLSSSGLLIGNYYDGKYFQVTSSGDIYAPSLTLVNGVLSLYGGTIQNSVGTAVIDLNASGGSLVFRAGTYQSYGPYAGSHYPVEIAANGTAFFGRGAISGGSLKASGTYTIPDKERPAVYFYDAPVATDGGGA